MESIPQRTCCDCKQSYPLTSEYWHKNKADVTGFNRLCKECAKARARKWHSENRERNKESCRQWAATHQEEKRAYAIANAEHIARVKREWNKAHPEKVRKYWKGYAERHPEAKCKSRSKSQKNNREAARIRNRRYAKRHPQKMRVKTLNRWAMFKNADGHFTKQDIKNIYEEQQGRCAYCGITLHDVYEIDHVIPLSREGSNWPDNLMVACPSCNSSKGNYLLEEWQERRGW